MPEEWKPVAGYEGYYEVSDQGRVRSIDRFNMAGSRIRGRIMRLHANTSGHVQLVLSRSGYETRYVHHLVLEAFVGPCPEGSEGCHNDGDPRNNCLSNLRWDTRSSNVADQVAHGVHNSASRTHCKRNHLLAGPNLMPSVSARGWRGCLSCNRAHARPGTNSENIQAISDAIYASLTFGKKR